MTTSGETSVNGGEQVTTSGTLLRCKHNLVISLSVGSGHPNKFSYEIAHECLLG